MRKPLKLVHYIRSVFPLFLLVLGGCGTSQYDQAARARMETLRQGALAGVQIDAPEWQPYQSPQNYSVDFPGPARPMTQSDEGMDTEQLKVTAGGIVYELNFVRADGIDMKKVADQMGAALTELGYARKGGTTRNTNGLVRQDVQFEMPDKSSQAMIRVFELDTARVCGLSVVGKDLNADDVKRFFDSLKSTS